jgi:hypothetical protein
MPVLSLNIPNFISGVSQQTDTLRFPSQAEESINGYPSIVEGLAKRPPTKHLATLAANSTPSYNFGTGTNFNFHLIDRGENERFFVVLGNNGINVYGLDGSLKSVYTPGSNAGKTTEFLTSTNPRSDYKLLTIADYTFILKKTLKPRMLEKYSSPTLSIFSPITNIPGATQKTSLFFVKQGSYDNEYVVMFRVPTGAYNISGGAVTWKWVRYVVQTLHPYDNTTSTFTDLSPDIKVFGYTATEATGSGVAGSWTAMNSGNPIFTQNAQESITSTLRIASLFTTAVGDATYGVNAQAPSYLYSAGQTNTGANATNRFIFGDAQAGNTWGFWATHTIINFPYTTSVSDSASGTLMGVAFDEVQAFSDLPNAGPDGMNVKVVGYPQDTSDDYWLKFSASSGAQNKGTWKESVSPGVFTDIDWQYMPYILVKLSSGDFALTPLDGVTRTYGAISYTAPSWGTRKVGDDETNELPSFINKMDFDKLKSGATTYSAENTRINSATDATTISDIFFYKNRLGFLAGENIIFSEAGEYFNFFRTTITQLLDDSPIDVGVSATSVNKLNYAIPFFDRLILFSEQNQFTLTSSDNLTPKSVSIQLSTSFSVQTNVAPLPVGKNIYFPYSKNNFSGMREYYVNPANSFMDSADISLAIPAYIEGNVTGLTGTDTENIIFVLTDKLLNGCYVYKYLINGDDKIQSSWSKFQMSPGANILAVIPLKEIIYLFVKRGTFLFLEQIDLQAYKKQNFLPYQPYLDRFCSTSGGGASATYNSTTNETEVTLPYPKGTDEVVTAVSSESVSTDFSASFTPNSETPVYLRIAPSQSFSETEITNFNNTLHPSGSFSVAVWVKLNTTENHNIFYKQTNQSVGWPEWYLDVFNGNLRFFVGNTYNFGFAVSKALPSSITSSWILVTCIYNSSSSTLSIKTSDSGITTSASSVTLNASGSYIQPASSDLNGKLGAIGIWSKVLSAGEITDLETGEDYDEFSATLKTNLNGWWPLNEAASAPKIESQFKLVNFVINSGVLQANDSPRKSSYINTFDVIPVVRNDLNGSNTRVYISGNRTTAVMYLGVLYPMEHLLARISLRSPGSKGGQSVVNTGTFNLRYANLNFNNTKEFKIQVFGNTSDKTALYTYSKKFLTPKAGIYKFPIYLKNTEARIKFLNESPYPSAFMSMDIEGFFATRSQKAS